MQGARRGRDAVGVTHPVEERPCRATRQTALSWPLQQGDRE